MSRTQPGPGVYGRRAPTPRQPSRPSAPGPRRAAPPKSAARTPRPGQASEPVKSPRLLGLHPDPIAALEAKSSGISDPVEKLRFLRQSLERYESVDEKLQAVPGSPLRWLAYRFTRVDSARPLFSENPNGALGARARKGTPLPRRARRTMNVAGAILVAAAGIALAAYPRARVPHPSPSLTTPADGSAGAAAFPAIAEALPDERRGVVPERIWLVDSGKGFELYSNGLRIDTTHAVAGEPRRFRAFDVATGLMGEAQEQPIGIVYHTSESDIWPLEESFNEKLRDSSQNLLHYLSRNRVYHYLIDRFGQVFRVVQEETKANHAGMSIWSAGRRVYLNLNGSTLGMSFETRWEGGRALPITRAQLEAGRSLTDYLRQKWSIAPEMCVTHGLVSVNPRKHLIGHHIDWARGFPFSAYGLPDQYQTPSPAVLLFGFDHDDGLVAQMGEPWAGVAEAEQQLAQAAERDGRPLADLRRQRTRLYDRWLAEQAVDVESPVETSADARRERRSASGG